MRKCNVRVTFVGASLKHEPVGSSVLRVLARTAPGDVAIGNFTHTQIPTCVLVETLEYGTHARNAQGLLDVLLVETIHR